MTADEIKTALSVRWPDGEYLSIDEAPMASDRSGRRIDRLVISLWKSRGLQLDAVEIKVSIRDWRKELREAGKAEWWFRHSNRFWIAVPVEIAKKVQEDLPETWGLLACAVGKKTKVVVKAPHTEAEPLEWGPTVGLLRAAADSGLQALWRAEARGREEGKARAEISSKRESAEGQAERELAHLRKVVSDFEAASGVVISDRWGYPDRLGVAVGLLLSEYHHPGFVLNGAAKLTEVMRRHADRLGADADQLESLAAKVQELSKGVT